MLLPLPSWGVKGAPLPAGSAVHATHTHKTPTVKTVAFSSSINKGRNLLPEVLRFPQATLSQLLKVLGKLPQPKRCASMQLQLCSSIPSALSSRLVEMAQPGNISAKRAKVGVSVGALMPIKKI